METTADTLYGYVDGGLTSTDEWAYEFMFEAFDAEQIVRNSSAIVIASVVAVEPQFDPPEGTATGTFDVAVSYDIVISDVLAGDTTLEGNTYTLPVSLLVHDGAIYQFEEDTPIPVAGQKYVMFLAPAGFTGELPPSGGRVVAVGQGFGRIPIDAAQQDGTLDLVMSLKDQLGTDIAAAAATTEAGEPTESGEESPLLVSHMDIEGPDNSLVGYVVIEPDCVYIHLTEPESPKWPDRAVIWPRGTVLDLGAQAVVLPDGDTLVHEQESHFSGAGFAFDLESSFLDEASVSSVAAKCAERFDGMLAFGGVIPYEPTP